MKTTPKKIPIIAPNTVAQDAFDAASRALSSLELALQLAGVSKHYFPKGESTEAIEEFITGIRTAALNVESAGQLYVILARKNGQLKT